MGFGSACFAGGFRSRLLGWWVLAAVCAVVFIFLFWWLRVEGMVGGGGCGCGCGCGRWWQWVLTVAVGLLAVKEMRMRIKNNNKLIF